MSDAVLDLISGNAPRTEQMSLFAADSTVSGVEAEEIHVTKSRRTKKSKAQTTEDFGRGKIERRRSMLSRVDDVPFDELPVWYISKAISSCKTDVSTEKSNNENPCPRRW